MREPVVLRNRGSFDGMRVIEARYPDGTVETFRFPDGLKWSLIRGADVSATCERWAEK